MAQFAYVIDDDAAVRASLRALLTARDNQLVMAFSCGEAFLDDLDSREGGVVLLDLHMPGMSGMHVLEQMAAHRSRFPTIMLTGRGDVPIAVQAMRLGAVDFLEKPYDHKALFAAIDRSFARLDSMAQADERRSAAQQLIGMLSAREHEVLTLIVEGASNKAMAEQLGLSVRTVEVHRANVMAKLNVSSVSAAVHLTYAAHMAAPGAALDQALAG